MESNSELIERKLDELLELQQEQSTRLQQIHKIIATAAYSVTVLLGCILGAVTVCGVLGVILAIL